jgi:lysophospholipase L1-like esterase
MRKLFAFIALTSMALLSAQDWPQLQKYQSDNAKILDEKTPVKVVFMGNSITQGWADMRPEFFKDHGFIGRGIGGQTTPQMLLRLRQDVLELKPEAVVILAGINDIAQNTGPITLKETLGNIQSMAELALAHGINPIICSVLPANSFPWRPEIIPTQHVIDLNSQLQRWALEKNLVYVDFYTPMVDEKHGLKSDLGYDPVHPNVAGYQVMEPILLKALNQLLK